MLLPDDFRYHLRTLLSSPTFQQIAPLVILILVPALVLFINSHRHYIAATVFMVFDSLLHIFSFNWTDSLSNGNGSSERKKLRRKQHTRTRDDQVDRTASQDVSYDGSGDEGYYPGLVNISGTYCFMNSTLQAMASLSYLKPQLEKIHYRAVALDVPSPVIDSLLDLIHALNNPASSSRALRPMEIINTLSNHNLGKHNSLFSSREHQDAQELFQLLSECIKNEAMAVAKEIRRDRGLGELTQKDDRVSRDLSQTVFDGLTANRRSCIECGYTEAVMHFPFDSWQLAVPRLVASCRLEDCLDEYTRLELLNDCICRKCSMLATYHRLEQEAEKYTEAARGSNDLTSSKKKRARDSRKLVVRVKAALEEGRIEEDIKGVKLEKVFSKASTKQSMIARPPPVLALHLNRSMHYGHYAAKNNCRVSFPEILDLTPYTTSGQLSTQPSAPISSPPPSIPIQRSITPTPSTYAVPRTLYRLSAVVCHYGQHSFGHYVCFRRKPRSITTGDRRYAPPRLMCPLGCECSACMQYGPLREEDGSVQGRAGTGRGWLRISDDDVQEVGIERVLQEGSGAFMLYYERIQQPRSTTRTAASPRASEETVRPEEARVVPADIGNGEAHLKEGVQNGDAVKDQGHETKEVREEREREKYVDPRVVRRVSASASRQHNVAAPPISRSTSGSSAVTAVSSFSTKTQTTVNGEAEVVNDQAHSAHSHSHSHSHSHAHSRSHKHHSSNGSGGVESSSQQRPSMPPPSPSKLRKSRRSVSRADGSPVSSTRPSTPLKV